MEILSVLFGIIVVLVSLVGLGLARFVHIDEYIMIVLVEGLFRKNGKWLRVLDENVQPSNVDSNVKAFYTWDLFRPLILVATAEGARQFTRLQKTNARKHSRLGIVNEKLVGKAVGLVWPRHVWKPYHQKFSGEFSVTRACEFAPTLRKLVETWCHSTIASGGIVSMHALDELMVQVLPLYLFDYTCNSVDIAEFLGMLRQNNKLFEAMNIVSVRFASYVLPWHPVRKSTDQLCQHWRDVLRRMYAFHKQINRSTILSRMVDIFGLESDELVQTFYEMFIYNIDILSQSVMWILVNTGRFRCISDNIKPLLSNTAEWTDVQWREFFNNNIVRGSITESARYCPALETTFPEQLREPATIDQLELPTGTYVSMHARVLNQSVHEWDAGDQFDINRDFQNKFVFIYGEGERQCLGRAFAESIKCVFLATVLETTNVVLSETGSSKVEGVPYLNRNIPLVRLEQF